MLHVRDLQGTRCPHLEKHLKENFLPFHCEIVYAWAKRDGLEYYESISCLHQ
ncbi:hypothetical protein SLEP1_g57774 [Rubroshorea leprosula]|uniref:Uncharacterized protein n=1 Tax=Rubroshorea leprosula TaxID=152421 RepID=A0AAV5MQ37_9ROSI|nr:hypothetical protein SLEP1_g57774 [Rubroshorea leprosula]